MGRSSFSYVPRSPIRSTKLSSGNQDSEDMTTVPDNNKASRSRLDSPVISESTSFLLPEDQVSVDLVHRCPDEEISEYVFKQDPLYLSTCYDEFSRHFPTINISKSSLVSVPLVKYDISSGTIVAPNLLHAAQNGNPSHGSAVNSSATSSTPVPAGVDNILVHYYPALVEWYSTFRKVPVDNAHLLSGKVSSDVNLLIRLRSCTARQKCFEPIFGSAFLCAIVDDELIRITESFSFDATPLPARKQYASVYTEIEHDDAPLPSTPDYAGTSVNVYDASGAQIHIHMLNATVPEEFSFRDVFLVAQLSKVLTSDADRAIAPYFPRAAAPPDLAKHREACDRLARFRQPLALGKWGDSA